MSAAKTALIVGPGFIGWNVLDLLVAEGYTVSGLVRRQSHAEQIKASGGIPIQGDLNDEELVKKHVLQNDIIIHTAGADHTPSVSAILSALQQKATSPTTTPIFIHTSGTALLDDQASGAYKGDKIYSDNDPDSINCLPDTAPHRPIDLTIIRAAKALGQSARIAIMFPPNVYGINPAHNRLSMQNPDFARFALKHGYSGHVGKGLSVESQIHVLDLARGYVSILHYMEDEKNADALLQNPYFFCENGEEFSWKGVAEVIGKALHEKGRLADPTPRDIDVQHYGDLCGEATPTFLGLNSRSRADRLRELGWEAREKGMRESFLEDELEVILKEK